MKNKKIILIVSLCVFIILLGIVLAILLNPTTRVLFDRTGENFRKAGNQITKEQESIVTPTPIKEEMSSIEFTLPTQQPSDTPAPTPEPTPTPTPDPFEELYTKADTSMMKDIVNILLIGVDFSEERLTWNGKKEWHSDVMMVLAVNFEDNRADLISLPRDTYAKIPGIDGIYKMNASLNCGGGLYNDDGTVNPAGLEKVCETAEWMLGGIPVDYYYAVTMTSLKQLVDAFGGLDYDLEFSYTIQGRSYKKGMQHMDGQAVLDYCRVRKATNGIPASEQGDPNRVNRQKRILVAFFEQMKKTNLIVKIPEILDAFNGELFTNCTPAQTAALAVFAYDLDRSTIGMYSMGGTTASLFQWNFCFTDQENRVKIIKKVYGVNAEEYHKYTLKYGRYRWASMLYDKYEDICTPLKKYVSNLIEKDNLLDEENRHYTHAQRNLFERFTQEYSALKDAKAYADKEAKKARNGKSNHLSTAAVTYIEQLKEVQDVAIELAEEFNYTKVARISKKFYPTSTGWSNSPWANNYGQNKKFNEVIVDFN